MKGIVHIASKNLAAYFIALPICMGLHMTTHHDLCTSDTSEGYVISNSEIKCELCDLYHYPFALIESPEYYLEITQLVIIQLPFAEHPTINDPSLLRKRGPPGG